MHPRCAAVGSSVAAGDAAGTRFHRGRRGRQRRWAPVPRAAPRRAGGRRHSALQVALLQHIARHISHAKPWQSRGLLGARQRRRTSTGTAGVSSRSAAAAAAPWMLVGARRLASRAGLTAGDAAARLARAAAGGSAGPGSGKRAAAPSGQGPSPGPGASPVACSHRLVRAVRLTSNKRPSEGQQVGQ